MLLTYVEELAISVEPAATKKSAKKNRRRSSGRSLKNPPAGGFSLPPGAGLTTDKLGYTAFLEHPDSVIPGGHVPADPPNNR